MARARTAKRPVLRRPLATLVLAGVLAADAAWVAGPPGPDTSVGGEAVWWAVRRWGMSESQRALVREAGRLRRDPAQAGAGLAPGVFVLRGAEPAEPLRLMDQDRISWDAISAALTQTPERLAAVRASFGVVRRGLWALTREERVDVVRLEPMERGGFDGVDPGRVRALLASHGWRGAPDGPTDQSHARVLWWGYAHNLVSIATLAAFLWSLGWVRDVPGWVRRRRAARRVARGVCPRCAYPLRGLEDGVCPECGAAVAEWATGAEPQRRG
jgi:hypothetical protein